jgi:predicted N-formylglutamate amidohydrolase
MDAPREQTRARLEPDEPPPFEIVNRGGRSRFVLTCEHASAILPRRLGDLGVPEVERRRHIGWDIGAAVVARRLSALIDAPLAMSGYSRLAIDCNRRPGGGESIPEISEATPIPGNVGIDAGEREVRAEAMFWPYHEALHELLEGRAARVPVMVAVHSFTPVYHGEQRPWDVGITYRHDPRLAKLMIRELEKEGGLCVGENQPYPVDLDTDYAVPVHAERRGIPHCLIEMRHDRIETDGGCHVWAERLARVIEAVSHDPMIARSIAPARDVVEPRLPIGES